MRQVYVVAGGVVLAVGLIIGFFAVNQANREQLDLTARLQSRAHVLADTLAQSAEAAYGARSTSTMQRLIDRFVDGDRIAALGVFDSAGVLFAASEALPLPDDPNVITDVMDSDEPQGWFVREGDVTFYTFAVPLHEEGGRVVGALAVTQYATYIDERVAAIWRDNILRFLSQMTLIVLGFLVLVRWVFARAVASLAASLQEVRKGNDDADIVHQVSLFQPLVGEMRKMTHSLQQARERASEEARMRFEKLDSPWTAERLQEFMKAHMKNRQIFVVSNREPYMHTQTKKGVSYAVPAHGMVTAVDALMQACGGTWIAHGSGDADRAVVDAHDKVRVPPEEPRYTLKRVWLNDEEVKGHYVGLSNEALFPLCLMSHTRPVFRPDDWAAYKRVNAKFAEALLAEIRHVEQPLILVQDLHFALVPRIIKKSRPDAQVALFWHHPWPSAEQFSICPWRAEILDGMLGADVIGFHIQQHCNNFLETIGKELEARIDFEHFAVVSGGHMSVVRPFPISVPFTNSTQKKGRDKKRGDTAFARFGVHTPSVVLGVDRLDYTKGIVERLRGVEHFFDTYPEYKKQVTFLQIAAPSREAVQKYREYGQEVVREVERINARLQSASWKPVVFLRQQLSHDELRPLYREAQVCLVTSLHDGMNLVAKEYIAERESSGVLILSSFTGAARELTSALIVNPYSPEDIATALKAALVMPASEQYRRMKALQSTVSNYNVYRWAMELIRTLARTDLS